MMKTPPKMLSPKDCSYLADLLETLLTTAKKAEDYAKRLKTSKSAILLLTTTRL